MVWVEGEEALGDELRGLLTRPESRLDLKPAPVAPDLVKALKEGEGGPACLLRAPPRMDSIPPILPARLSVASIGPQNAPSSVPPREATTGPSPGPTTTRNTPPTATAGVFILASKKN